MNRHIVSFATLALVLGASTPVLAADTAKPKSADTATAISDTGITAKVKAKFVGDDRLKNSDISVTTANGVVSLTGTTATADGKDVAEELTRQVEGVRNVDNLIEAPTAGSKFSKDVKKAANKTEQVTSDSWITTKVKSSLLADGLTKGLKISVNTKNGVVILSGNAETQAEADKAVEIAQKIKGVNNVDSSGLKVGSKG